MLALDQNDHSDEQDHDAIGRRLAALVQRGPRGRSAAYLRLLYSPEYLAWARAAGGVTKIDPALQRLLRCIDYARLEIEQRARIRNLRAQLTRFPSLWFSEIDEDRQLELVAAYCDAELFWVTAGRTMFENFCLAVHPIVAAMGDRGGPALAELVRVEGVSSGLSRGGARRSPWDGLGRPHRLGRLGSLRFEEFDCGYSVVGADGGLRMPARGESRQCHAIRVVARPGVAVEVECDPA